MKKTELRQLIKESIKDYVREIEHSGNKAAIEAKIAKIGEAIEARNKKINKEGIDEEMHDMIDLKKIKQYEKEVKELQRSLEKYKNQLAKMEGKSAGAEETSEEIVDEVKIEDEKPTNENLPSDQFDELASQMFKDGADYDEIVAKLDDMGCGLNQAEIIALNATGESKEHPEELNESFIKMQKLAGIIK